MGFTLGVAPVLWVVVLLRCFDLRIGVLVLL